MPGKPYVLITPARDEEAHIAKTIEAVCSQTILPVRWLVVNDGSTDRTEEIASRYTAQYGFLQLLNIQGEERRSFSSKVVAFEAGYAQLENTGYEFIGCLDADVSFGRDYFERLLEEFESRPRLGLAGGVILELVNGRYMSRDTSMNSVAGAVQLFRRECYEQVGGYIPILTGGEDAAAEIMARMKKWDVRTFPELFVFHHRRVGYGQGGILRTMFRFGMAQYRLGYHPLFQLAKCMYRMKDKPFCVGGMSLLVGYWWCSLRREKRVVSREVVRYLRSEQLNALRFGLQENRQKRIKSLTWQ